MRTGIVKPSEIRKSLRFDGSYHLAESQIYESLIYSHEWQPLSRLASAIFTSGRNKRMYTAPAFGYPFLSNSDVVSANPFATCKYDSRKYNNDPSGFLKEGMIVTGRVGAIGQTAYVSRQFEERKAVGSDNMIRIVCNPSARNGYVYAFLASRVGNLMLWKHAAGGVQPYITDKMVGEIPIPVFPSALQEEIDGLVREAAALRDRAAGLLAECVSEIEAEFRSDLSHRSTGSVSVRSIRSSHNKRFEANYWISSGAEVDRYIRDNFEWKPLAEVCDKIYRPGIFKRQYTSSGVVFLGGADLLNAVPTSDKFLSKRQVDKMPELLVKDNWLLVSCGGTIGNCVIVNRPLSRCAVSQHVMRIVPSIFPIGYVYAFLSSKLGKALILKNPFGAVIPQMEPAHFQRLPIPVLNSDKMQSIHERIMQYKDCLGEACEKELRAISMVEREVESWDQASEQNQFARVTTASSTRVNNFAHILT